MKIALDLELCDQVLISGPDNVGGHIRANVYVDKELAFVTEIEAWGAIHAHIFAVFAKLAVPTAPQSDFQCPGVKLKKRFEAVDHYSIGHAVYSRDHGS
jgi:hypothetical protein